MSQDLYYQLFYFMEKGDIEKYDDFLDCKIVNTKFFNKLSDVQKIRRCFYAFLVLNIIVQGIEKIENCFDCVDFYNEIKNW